MVSPMKACPNCQASYPPNYTHCPRDGGTLVEVTTWQEGTVVRGKYRILSKLGEGGMAAVYKAMHTRFEELRALKVMHAELAGDHAFVKRFMQEAVLTRKIQHANAVRVEDIDEAEDCRPFMVMEYLEGRCLKEVIATDAPLGPWRVSSIARQIAGALNAAHSLGVVHRDVKPANVVLISQGPTMGFADRREQAKVLDFGIAKAKEARLDDSVQTHATLTRTGNVIGTPTYMSPEQARGMRGADLDGRSDIYSLGIVIYQMLAGGLPFKAETSMEWLLAHLQVAPTPLGEFRADLQIPSALSEVVMRCLEKDRNLRPPTAEALIQELEQAESAMHSGYDTTISSLAPQPTDISKGHRPTPNSAEVSLSPAEVQPVAEEAAAKRSGNWIVWTAGAVALLVLAGALGIWNVQLLKAARSVVPANTVQEPNTTAAPPTATQPVVRDQGASPAPQVGNAQTQTSTASSPSAGPPPVVVPEQTAPQPNDSAATGSPSSATPHKTASPKPGFAAAVKLAKEDESLGRFEDALQEYERAAALDPSDASVKRHIALLRARISRENDLIH